jgi:carboxylate-amine ligase
MLVQENIWRAQRYGVSESLMDFGIGELVPFSDLVDELTQLVAEDAASLDCVDEVMHTKEIVRRGTSADRQRAIYHDAVASGADDREALVAVVDFLIEETVTGL